MVTSQTSLKLNILVQSKINTKPLSITIKCFFIMLHIFFALDFGFMKQKSPKINLIIKLLTITQSTIFTVVLAFNIFDLTYKNIYTYSSFFLDSLIAYAFTVTLVVAKNTFHDYQTDLNSFDVEIEEESSKCGIEYKIITCFCLLISFRTSIYLMFDVLSLDYVKFRIHCQILYFGGLISFDTVLVVYSYVFYSAYLRLKKFTAFVRNDKSDIVSCHYLYKSLVDIIEKMKTTFDVVLILTLIANTTDVTMHVYIPFAKESVKKAVPLHLVAAYLTVIQQLLMLFSPAFTAGLLAGQVEKLKLVLYDKLVMERGESSREKDIRRFAAYIDGRPLRFKVWRVVPLDLRLPVIVINVIVTYLIVMIQFTHKNEK